MPAPKDPEKRAQWIEKNREKRKKLWEDPEYRQRMVEKHTGKKRSPESLAKLSDSLKGHQTSPETRKKISEAHKGKKLSDEQRAQMSASRIGVKRGPHSQETKDKIGAANTGKRRSEETKASWRGRKFDDATKAKMSAKKTAYYQSLSPEERLALSEQRGAWWKSLSEEERQAITTRLRDSAPAEKNYQSWIENYYAEQLDAQGVTYERQVKIGWYQVDFYIESENRIVEINGCWFHCCEECGFNEYPGKREKDAKRYAYLRRKGYIVEVIWEHDMPRKPRHLRP